MSSKKTKTALITGISGMVGSHLAEYLMSHTDWSIHGLIRWRSPLENLENIIPYVNNQQRVYFLRWIFGIILWPTFKVTVF